MKPHQDRSEAATTTTVPQSLFGSLFQQHPVTSLCFSGDSNSLAVACGREVILCDSSGWLPTRDLMAGTVIERLHIEGDPPVHQALYSPDSSILAVTTATKAAGPEFRVSLYSRLSGSQAWQLRESRSLSNKGEKEMVLSLFSFLGLSSLFIHSNPFIVLFPEFQKPRDHGQRYIFRVRFGCFHTAAPPAHEEIIIAKRRSSTTLFCFVLP
jgi:WD40 repeat protein